MQAFSAEACPVTILLPGKRSAVRPRGCGGPPAAAGGCDGHGARAPPRTLGFHVLEAAVVVGPPRRAEEVLKASGAPGREVQEQCYFPQTVSWDRGSRPREVEGLDVRVHPLVLVNIADHITRFRLAGKASDQARGGVGLR